MLELDIKEAIDANLTAEVGKRLQARLARLEILEQHKEATDAALIKKDEEIKKLRETCASYNDIANREKLLIHNEQALVLKEWDLKVKEARLEGRERAREDNLNVVLAVFANNRFKYNENANVPAGLDQYGNARTAFVSKDATLEG